VPEVVSVMGHDNSAIAELSIPPLTTIGFTSRDLTERLIASVVSVLQGGPVLEPVSLVAEVVVRGSA